METKAWNENLWFSIRYIQMIYSDFFRYSTLMCLIYDFSFLINKQWKIIRWSVCVY